MLQSLISSILYLLYFTDAIVSGLDNFREESEIVFPSVLQDGRAYPAQGKSAAGPTSREVRSISNGDEYESQEFYPRELRAPAPPGHRGAAATSSSSSSLSSSASPRGLQLKIPAFGRELYLSLTRDSRFLSGSFAVHSRRSRHHTSVRSYRAEHACYYSGFVHNSRGSLASFSTCGGLMGFIQINEEFIFIEPLNHTTAVTGYAHRVYRRKRSMDEKSAEKQASQTLCGISADKRRPKSKRQLDRGRGRRYTYKLAPDYNVETLVVADTAMVNYHGADAVRRFILTVMNMVFNLFQHKSLGIQMNLRVTKLVLLHESPEDLYIGHHGEKMLESFCKWQHEEFGKKNYFNSDMSSSWREDLPAIDSAILITRKDFCVQKDEPCDTVGIAYLSGMCSEKRKCVLAEDNGLNLAFTIAHEMGHNMGMNHDNDHPSCADGLHIMSGEWIKGQNLGDVSWSQCSRDDLERFLRSKVSNCLLHTDPQSLNSVMLSSKLPGMIYTADEQCQILFGPTATFCKEMQHVICTGLWCKLEGEQECKTKLDPPLDGTECEREKWCKAGECVSKTPLPDYIDGEWSTWNTWSTCSRTCDAGVHFRQRTCDNPRPGPEGKNCQGSRVQYRICKKPPCPTGVPNFRNLQCQSFKRPSYQKHSLQWYAVTDEEEPCALFCSPLGKDQPMLISEKVLDGTPCGLHEADICANGTCQKIGCDDVLGSSAREDHCGVCNGNGRSCKVIKGDFNHTRGAGYVEALVIPAGARRIRVVEEKPAHSYLALRDTSKHSINSDWKIEHPGTFNIAGTIVHYVRRGFWEKISAKGPTTSPLHLMVLLFNDQNYGIHYEYTIPIEPRPGNHSAKTSVPHFMWTHSGWEDCAAMCGGGERKTLVTCTKIMSKTTTIVDNRKCKQLRKPEPLVRKCNQQPCQTRWMMTEWTPCSRTCGKGSQSRQVACTQQLRNGTLIRARERDCPGSKPASLQRCEGQDCLTVWEAGIWSECSVKCGKGARHRTIKCTNPRKKCDLSTRPKEAEDCEDYSKCYVWRTGDWSKCSITCGKGMQSRVIQCMHKVTGRHGNDCFPSEKPAAYRPCHLKPCNEKINVNTITSPRLAALTFKCLKDQWQVYCKIIRETNLCQDMRWYQRCCETCRDFYAQKLQHKS
ncbi:A disintegrin and metalloproteinase with thrombospondin motifs 19-like [Leucoraja erinacea]|uniref:A disintegrin and metalloproteinase with thrombospondin motifs 19-like n=1 Tax=Leucoraja erinaceus TaxID=7782 RepID=UPI002453BF29|nr:A disintegrin and metalloproteinase with thrombospondin motifs 19-like [Leucoraja erinacea]